MSMSLPTSPSPSPRLSSLHSLSLPLAPFLSPSLSFSVSVSLSLSLSLVIPSFRFAVVSASCGIARVLRCCPHLAVLPASMFHAQGDQQMKDRYKHI